MAKSNGDIITGTLIVSILAIGGWLVFNSLTTMFGLGDLSPMVQLLVGLVVIFFGTKLGLKRFT